MLRTSYDKIAETSGSYVKHNHNAINKLRANKVRKLITLRQFGLLFNVASSNMILLIRLNTTTEHFLRMNIAAPE